MKTAVFLYNPESGKGKIARNVGCISTIFQAYGYDVTPQRIDFTVNPFDGNETIDLMVVAGGDGTVNYAVNAMKRKGLDIPIGVIPAGTANDFAGAVGMSREPLEAARQIASGAVDRVDCGCVNGLYFVNIFSFGIFTTTSQRTPDQRKHKIGKLAYLIEGVKELRAMHAVPLKVVADGQAFDFNSLMVLVFNGEIYNYRELRRQLIAAGHAFSTQGDAEVVLHGFEQWGEGVLDRLRGMFAFALYDTATGELFCARDTFGIKPLYYAVEDGRILHTWIENLDGKVLLEA